MALAAVVFDMEGLLADTELQVYRQCAGPHARAPLFTIASRIRSILLPGILLDGRMSWPGWPRSGAELRAQSGLKWATCCREAPHGRLRWVRSARERV